MAEEIKLVEITDENWREIIKLKVHKNQTVFVAEPSYYLLLCHYGNIWHPKAIQLDNQYIGFIMWAIDPDDNSGWIGGFLIDQQWQGKGFGKKALESVLTYLKHTHNISHFALSVQPQNPVIKLYESIGFVKTNEWEGNEIVMRIQN
jgi:diamine N-acetyltransferase